MDNFSHDLHYISFFSKTKAILGHFELYKRPFSVGYRKRGSHARGVHPTQDASLMGTAMMKQEEEADTRIIARE